MQVMQQVHDGFKAEKDFRNRAFFENRSFGYQKFRSHDSWHQIGHQHFLSQVFFNEVETPSKS